MDQRLKDKCLELHECHDKQFKVLMRQQETLQLMREDVTASEACLAERKASLDAKEGDISFREENLEATLRAKDKSLEALVQQCTKGLEDKHEVALATLATDHAAQLKRLFGDLGAASSANIELDRKVSELYKDLAESVKKVEALKEEARQTELHLAHVQS